MPALELMHFSALCREPLHSQKRLFERAAEEIEGHTGLSGETIYRELLAREKLGSTGVGEGVAIPHSRIAGCESPVGCLMTLSEPVDFAAIDGVGVDIVFVLLVPEAATQQHLDLLAALATRFSDAATRERLRNATTAAELAACLADIGVA